MPREQSGSCCLEIEFTLKPGKRREFTRSFEDLNCHEGEGHVKTTVYEDREEPGHMIWTATWTSRGTLELYLHSEHFGVLVGAIRVLSTSASCRLIDGAQVPMGGRTPTELKSVQIDLEQFEGPKN